MGLFHCPVGAAFRSGEGCIDCGMCVARTREERKRSADAVRRFLRSESSARLERYVIRKIAVSGKGGVGKSTLTALFAVALRDMGYEVLVIDADASNSGLNRKLGIAALPEPLLSLVPGFGDGKELPADWLTADEIALEDVPSPFVAEDGRLLYMTAGKLEDALEGCACTIADVAKTFLSKVRLTDRQIILIDNEAGVESFGRGLEQLVDTVLIVTEPSFDSIAVTAKIRAMAEGLGIRRIRAVVNKTRDAQTEKTVFRKLAEQDVRYLGVLRSDDALLESGLLGIPAPEGASKEAAERLVRLMLDEAEMPYNPI